MKKSLFKLFFVMLFLLTISFTIVFNNNNSVKADEIEEETVEPSLNIYKKNISYSSEIYIMYAVSYEGIDTSVNPVKMLFFDNIQDEYTPSTASYVVDSTGSTTISGVACKIFYSKGLAAKEMTDDIYARAYVEIDDEIIYSDVVKYSVLEYYYEIKEAGTASTNILNLLEAMVNYGAAAQINFNYNTDKLANATYYKVSVENAVLSDGFTSGRFKAEEQVTLTAPLKEGYVFKNWTNANSDVVSTDVTYTLTVTQDETLTANYEEEVAVTPVTLTLTKEAAYDATADTLDLPSTVTFDYNNETVTENVTWDTTTFVVNQIGKQKLYGTLSNDSYKLDELSIEINVLPYTFYLNEETNEYTITKYYGNEQDVVIPSTFDNKYITKIGDSVFNNCSSLKNIFISKEIKFVLGGAFYNCTNLEKVYYLGSIEEWCGIDFCANNYYSTPMYYADNFYLLQDNIFNEVIEIEIPDSISYIGNHQFSGFKNVEKITISDRVENIGSYAFYNCSNLVEIVIPDSVIEIKACAFLNCTGLNTITLGKNIKTILGSNFGQCTNLKNVYFNGTLENWCSIEFELDTATPMYYGEIIYMLDENNEWYELTNVEIPNTVASIGKYQFYGFKKILSVDISNSVIEINSNAFSNCTSLKNVVIPDSVENIGSYAFYNCSNLVEIVIPDSVVKIGISAFSSCTNLKNVTISNSITSISDHAFAYCSNLCEIIIPKNVTIIDRYAFLNCSNLLCIEIPNTVKSIGSSAFSGCDSLTSVIFEENSQLTSIGNESFYRCDNLISIVISENITNIGTYAFYDCENLKIIYNLSDLELTIGSTDHGYVAYYAKYIHNELPREVSLEKEVAYDATVDTLELPGTVTFTYNEEKNTQNVTWDTSTFIVNQIGEQVIYGIFSDDELYDQYNIKRGYIYITIDVLPYTFYNSIVPSEYTIKKYYGITDETTIPTVFNDLPVTRIGDNAFENNVNLTNICIPNSVKVIGKNAFSSCTNLTNVVISKGVTYISDYAFSSCASLTNIVIPEGLTYINNYTFLNCSNLESAVIPEGITSIGKGAFSFCSNLKDINMPSTLTSIDEESFKGCCSLTHITIPSGVMHIGSGSFSGCSSLIEASIPEGVESIEGNTFVLCVNLKSIQLPSTILKIENNAFTGCSNLINVEIPTEVTKIGIDAFRECISLTSVSFEAGSKLLTICDSAFKNCSNLTSIQIPSSVTNIGIDAFAECNNLKKVVFETGSNLTTISESTFENCSSIAHIQIPSGVQSIGEKAFYNCNSLVSVELSDTLTSIASSAFSDCSKLYLVINNSSLELALGSLTGITKQIINRNGNVITNEGYSYITTSDNFLFEYYNETYTLVGYLGEEETIILPSEINGFNYSISKFANGYCENIIIPKEITSIGSNAFAYSSNLKNVTFEEGSQLTNIGSKAFYYCNGLMNIEIPNSVISIGASAFYECRKLNNLTLPISLTSISGSTFYNCSSLANITIPNNVTSVGHAAFEGCSSLTSVFFAENSKLISIDTNAFRYCSSLTNIEFPEGLKSVGQMAFSGCDSLTSIVLPYNLTNIGVYAFVNCDNLKKVYNLSNLELTIGSTDYGYVAYYAEEIYTSLPDEE